MQFLLGIYVDRNLNSMQNIFMSSTTWTIIMQKDD